MSSSPQGSSAVFFRLTRIIEFCSKAYARTQDTQRIQRSAASIEPQFMNNLIKLAFILLPLVFVLSSDDAVAQSTSAISGTTGTPIGGFGAGAVKFNANTGTFAAMTQPPADAYDFKTISGARFQFFSERAGIVKTNDVLKGKIVNGRADDDAIWPLHLVNFARVNGIAINMKGFSPLDNQHYDNMSLPYAFYEIKLTNAESSPAIAAFAFQWDAGKENFATIAGKGISTRSWTVYAASPDPAAVITSGSSDDQGFYANGICNNLASTRQAKVAVKVKLAPGETKVVRFVLAWYDDTDPELGYYMNLYNNSAGVAEHGLREFVTLQQNAEELVNRLRGSNLPSWLKNQTLNTLVNLSTNSMYKKDGRVAFAEGQWTCFGTMDQMWHARQIIGQLLPFYAWQELRYWARTQMKNGQIHHDFNQMGPNDSKESRSVLVAWDDTEHKDYRDVQKWVDLNCAMITSTYEIYQMTGDRKQFDFLWPYLKKAALRILDQVNQYGSKEFPYTFDHSENSYDAGGDPNPFNANFSAVAYKVMVILSKEKGEKALALRYQQAYDTVVKSYAARYLNDQNFKLGKHVESYFGGQWLALNMKLGEIWTATHTDYVLDKLNTYYQPYYKGLGNPKGTYDEWTPYILVHHAGLMLNTNRVEQWSSMQKDAYERQYSNPNLIFDHPLNILPAAVSHAPEATNIKSGNQYISMPGLWRNYYDIIGYYRDIRTKALWLKPILPAELNHQLKDGLYTSPEGYGKISCTESGQFFQNRDIFIKPDQSIEVRELHLADQFGRKATIEIAGKRYAFVRTGTGYAKELVIQLNRTIDKKGLRIVVTGDPGAAPPALPAKLEETPDLTVAAPITTSAYAVLEAESATKSAGTTIAQSAALGRYVTSCNNFDYLQFSNVDFGTDGAATFMASVSSNVAGSGIEIVLDNVAGEALGICNVPKTGTTPEWRTVSASISKVTGIHDVILRFTGSTSENLMNIDKLTFKHKDADSTNPFK